jgi:hypothetical protein
MTNYNTNLAAEFYALSMLHRLGYDATLTLGNKKSVDIVVTLRKGKAVTIDVKGLAGKTGWPMDNYGKGSYDHFIVFICFQDRIAEPKALPEVYVVPSPSVTKLLYRAPAGRRVMPLCTLRRFRNDFQDAWHLLKQKAV